MCGFVGIRKMERAKPMIASSIVWDGGDRFVSFFEQNGFFRLFAFGGNLFQRDMLEA